MTTATGTGGCTSTITASSQIFPTNCLQGGEFWRGPAGQAKPDCCNGASLAASHLDFTVVLFGEKRHMVDELRKRQLMMTQDGFGYRAEFFPVYILIKEVYITRHLKPTFPSHFSACAEAATFALCSPSHSFTISRAADHKKFRHSSVSLG